MAESEFTLVEIFEMHYVKKEKREKKGKEKREKKKI